jgi:hypothetical protein
MDWLPNAYSEARLAHFMQFLREPPLGSAVAERQNLERTGSYFPTETHSAVRVIGTAIDGTKGHDVSSTLIQLITSAHATEELMVSVALALLFSPGSHMHKATCERSGEHAQWNMIVEDVCLNVMERDLAAEPLVRRSIDILWELKGRECVEELLGHRNAVVSNYAAKSIESFLNLERRALEAAELDRMMVERHEQIRAIGMAERQEASDRHARER